MSDRTETAALPGGCAWIMQQLLRHPSGMISTRVGWSGGEGESPTEGNPGGHAEVVEVVFDPGRISYRDPLEYFFQVHRPDLSEDLVGSIYRSEIFYASEEQRQVAEETIRDVDASGHWLGSVATRLTRAGRFREDPVEDQNYFLHYPAYPDGSKPPSREPPARLASWRAPKAEPQGGACRPSGPGPTFGRCPMGTRIGSASLPSW